MSDTLSATISRDPGGSAREALYLGLVADDPHAPPARYSLDGIDRVDVRRGDARVVERVVDGGERVLVLHLADQRLSRQHAQLVRDGRTWSVVDQGSKNGTWIALQKRPRHVLADGDTIAVGHTMLVFRTTGGEAGDAEGWRGDAEGLSTMSPELAAQFATLAAAATSTVPIEVTGESGTGKELVARAVHKLSKRAGRFVAINCGALAPNLIEAELFGHRKGAFTGSNEERAGLVRSADGGTLFLDEIGELPAAAQTTLLRVLQEHEVLPVGADRPVHVDLRVVTATHRSLDADVDEHRFRADLRARLMGVGVALPPLRARPEDLGPLVAALLDQLAPSRGVRFAIDAAAALYLYGWPLNVRELERSLAAAIAKSRDLIELHHLPAALAGVAPARRTRDSAELPVGNLSTEERQQRDALAAAIAKHDGNLAAVARELGKDRTQIRRWMKRWGLSRGDDSDP